MVCGLEPSPWGYDDLKRRINVLIEEAHRTNTEREERIASENIMLEKKIV